MRALKVNHCKRLVLLLAIKLRGVISYSLYLPLLPLLPVILKQGKTVKANTLRLGEASGPRQHQTKSIKSISLLHIGESTVAGVGVDHFQQGLTACIARQFDCSWQALGSNGAAIADINQLMLKAEFKPADLILVTMGVNDTTSLTRRKTWLLELVTCIEQALARDLVSDSNAGLQAKVCFTQVPPMHLFPALPFPLNCFLGLRAWQLDLSLRQLCLRKGWHHLAIDMPLKQQWMALDGYHPNGEGYQQWAQKIEPLLTQTLDVKDEQ
jgi:lysophospholipase L1-like esterase